MNRINNARGIRIGFHSFRYNRHNFIINLEKSINENIISVVNIISLLNHETHADTSDFLNLLYANTMLPMITRLTRYGEFSATLIDNIISNKLSGTWLAGILLDDISDHLPVFLIAGENDVSKKSLSLKRKSAK